MCVFVVNALNLFVVNALVCGVSDVMGRPDFINTPGNRPVTFADTLPMLGQDIAARAAQKMSQSPKIQTASPSAGEALQS